MGKLYLHDIPVNTFIKYYMNNDINSKIINSNSRYIPQYEKFTTNYKYNYVYNIGEYNYSVYTVNQPTLLYNNDILIRLFNPDLYYKYKQYENNIYDTSVSYSNVEFIEPRLNSNVKSKLLSIQDDDELSEFVNDYHTVEVSGNNITYVEIDNAKYVSYDDYEYLKSKNATSGYNCIFNKINDEISDGIVRDELTQLYFIPISNPVSTYLNNVSPYKYFGYIGDKILYALSYDDANDVFYLHFNEKDDIKISLLSAFKDKNGVALYMIKTSSENIMFDKANNCYYYSVFVNGSDTEIGRIYILPEYNKIIIENGKTKYLDRYKNEYVYFDSTNQPVSPIVKYHNYMRNYKNNITNNSVADTSDATVYEATNALYFHKYREITTIGYAMSYVRTKTYPISSEPILTQLGQSISTIKSTPLATSNSVIQPYGLRKTLVDFIGKNENLNIKATSIYYDNVVIDTSSIPTNNSESVSETNFQVAELKQYNEYIRSECEKTGKTIPITDHVTSRIKTAFSNENVHIVRKYATYGQDKETLKDTETNPYISQGISIANIVNLTPAADGSITINLLNKVMYNKYIKYNKISKFLVIDDTSDKNNKATDTDIINKGYYYYYDVLKEERESSTVSKNVGNGTYYRIKLIPLGKYLLNFITAQNSEDLHYTHDRCANGTRYTYRIYHNIANPTNSNSLQAEFLTQLATESKLDKIALIFKGMSLYREESGISASTEGTPLMPYVPVKFGANTRQKKVYNSVDYLFNSTITNQNKNVNIPLSTKDNFTINEYFTSLFKNLLYVIDDDYHHNPGRLNYDTLTNLNLTGFIDYDRTRTTYDYAESDVFTNGVYTTPNINISDADARAIEYDINSKHPLDRLFNYKKYTLNAEEINAKFKEKKAQLYKNNIYSSDKIAYTNLSKNIKEYNIQNFDISDTVNKCFDLYSEYLYTHNRKWDKEKEIYNIDYSPNLSLLDLTNNEITSENVSSEVAKIMGGASKYTESDIKKILGEESFYRKDINNYLNKLYDEHNEFVFNNNEEYELRYTFTNTEKDKDVFFELIKALNNRV